MKNQNILIQKFGNKMLECSASVLSVFYLFCLSLHTTSFKHFKFAEITF